MKANIRLKTALTLAFFLAFSLVSKALEPVMYLDKDGKEQWVTNYKVITGYETVLTKGWYVIKGEIFTGSHVLSSMGIEVRGNVHIILTDNCLFDYDSWWGFVDSQEENSFGNFSTLNIYSQSFGENMGKMTMKLGNRYAFSVYNVNIYGGNFDISDVGSTGYSFHCQSLSIYNGKMNIHDKPSMDVDVLKLYGGELHCNGNMNIHSEVIFGQSSSDLICDFGRCSQLSNVFVFTGTTKTVTIEEGVTVTVGDKTYTERIPGSELKGNSWGWSDSSLSMSSHTDAAVLAVNDIESTVPEQNTAWYTIDGIRITGKPVSKGYYIHNGKKVFVK